MRLLSNVTEWFIEVTVFEDAAGLLSADFFVFLDVDAAIMEITAEMQLKREGGHIRVAARHRTDPGARQRFELVVLDAWLFVKVPDSRWLSLGDDRVDCGDTRSIVVLSQRRANNSVSSSTSGFPAPLALLMLKKDDRLERCNDVLQHRMQQKVGYPHLVLDACWQTLSWEGSALRSLPGCLDSARVRAVTSSIRERLHMVVGTRRPRYEP